jgi:hypothetical protein
MHVRICNVQAMFKVSEQASRCKVDPGHVRERRLRPARWCVVRERLTSGAYPSTSALPSKLTDKELHTHDHILPVPYTMSNQGLKIHREKWTQGFHMHRRPDHVHLDDTGDLARLRMHDYSGSVEDVLLATECGIYGPDVHLNYPILDCRRP